MQFTGPIEAFNFILNWDGRSVDELRAAFLFVQRNENKLFVTHLPAMISHLRAFRGKEMLGDPELIATDLEGNVLRGSLEDLRVVHALENHAQTLERADPETESAQPS